MYYNYYATQVMHHWQGSAWKRWNDRMRDYLIQTQANEGHENGSWYFEHTHSKKGGRLYNTAMAIMTLEVYYRYAKVFGTRTLRAHAGGGMILVGVTDRVRSVLKVINLWCMVTTFDSLEEAMNHLGGT